MKQVSGLFKENLTYLKRAIIIIVFFSFCVSIFSVNFAKAAINQQINYQGKLSDSSNVAVADGTYTIVFNLYTASSGGSPIWTETRSGGNVVSVASGLFSVMLGSVTPFTGVNFNQTLYLGVTVEADSEMTPRKILGSVPASIESFNLGGASSTQYLRTDQAGTLSANSSQTALAITQLGSGSVFTAGTSTATFLTVANTGNVGIGTTTPGFLFVVDGTSLFTGAARFNSSLSVTSGQTILANASSTNLTVQTNSYLGTVKSGTWNGTAIGPTFGGTGLTSYATGDLIYASGVNTLANRTIGSTGDVLSVSGGVPSWVATSTLGISGSLSGGTNGYLARWTSPSTLSTGLLLDNSTVAGVNATSSSYTFNLQGNSGTNPFNIASSTGTSLFTVLNSGNVGVATTTPGFLLTVDGTALFTGSVRLNSQLNVTSGQTILANASTTNLTVVTNSFLGIVRSGTWNGTAIGPTFGGTGLTSYATGDLIYASGSNTLANKVIGTTGDVLSVVGGIPSWVATSTLGITATLSGGTTGFVTRWLTPTTVGTGKFIDDGTVAGINATSSSYTFNLQGNSGTNPFNIASSTGTSLFTVLNSGNVGVATTTPGFLLTVDGTSLFTGAARFNSTGLALSVTGQTTLANASSTSLTISGNSYLGTVAGGIWNGTAIGPTFGGTGLSSYATGDLIYSTGSNTLGKRTIGSTGDVLSVVGGVPSWVATSTLGFASSAITASLSNGFVPRWNGSSFVNSLHLDNGTVSGINATSSSYTFNLQGNSGTNPFNIASSTGTSLLAVLHNGNVGIGTSTPGSILNIQGTSGYTGQLFDIASSSGATYLHVMAGGNVGVGTSTPGVNFVVQGAAGTNDAFRVASSSGAVQLAVAGNGSVVLGSLSADPSSGNTNGATYYNTTTNVFRCYVNGAWQNCDTAGSKFIQKTADQNATSSNTTLGDDSQLMFSMAANSTYYIQGSIDFNMSNATADGKFGWTVPTGATINLQTLYGAGSANLASCNATSTGQACAISIPSPLDIRMQVHGIVTTAGTAGLLHFQFAQNTSNGASAPTVVSGSWLMITNSTNSGGADLAELYYSKDPNLAPGDVVTLDPSIYAGVSKSTIPYDSKALGIVSTKPGLVLGLNDINQSGGNYPIELALSGRVPVKVSTKNGPIEPGDYLTSSDIPGVAMKATAPGFVFGQALTAYDGTDIGTVTVFLKQTFYNNPDSFDSGLAILKSISDPNAKVSGYSNFQDALDLINGTTLHSYKYIDQSSASSTLSKLHIGFTADEADPILIAGEGADQNSINGIVFASVKALDNKINNLDASTTLALASLAVQISSIESLNNIVPDPTVSPNIFSILQSFGTEVVDGISYLKNMFVEHFTAQNLTIKGGDVTKTGFTIYDRATGLPICVFFENGIQQTEAGECPDATLNASSTDASSLESPSTGSGGGVIITTDANNNTIIIPDTPPTEPPDVLPPADTEPPSPSVLPPVSDASSTLATSTTSLISEPPSETPIESTVSSSTAENN